MVNIFIADGQTFEEKDILSEFAAEGIHIRKQCQTSEELVDAVKQEQPDVILLSLTLGGLGAFEAIDKIKLNYPRIGIVIMLVHADGPFPKRLLDTGASGFVSRNTAPADVVRAINGVKQGDKYISPEIAQKIAISLLPGGEESPLDRLSEREMQVMLQLSQGDSPLQISSRLALSPKTVSTYKHRVRDKLRVDDTQEIFALAGTHGLVAR
jgi:two-component system invasion response regulator UvrY